VKFYEYCEMADEHPADDVVIACAYLEAKNFIFSLNFDLEDALTVAERAYRQEVTHTA
jgi:hypothetical protein